MLVLTTEYFNYPRIDKAHHRKNMKFDKTANVYYRGLPPTVQFAFQETFLLQSNA